MLRCVGAHDGAPCAHAALVDLRAGAGQGVGREREVGTALEWLHMGHELPLHATCHRWRAVMCAAPRSWATDWTARRCATICLGRARARCTAPRVCGFVAVRHATPRVWCCSL